MERAVASICCSIREQISPLAAGAFYGDQWQWISTVRTKVDINAIYGY